MSLVWRKLSRINKKASKFNYIFQIRELTVEGTNQWQPNKLTVIIYRRNRKKNTESKEWEATISNPFRGLVVWSCPEALDIVSTLFYSVSSTKYDSKEWTILIENTDRSNRKTKVASFKFDLAKYTKFNQVIPKLEEFDRLELVPASKKVRKATISFNFIAYFLKEGYATDDDMISIASLISVNSNLDVGNLDDFDDPAEQADQATARAISDIANQLQQLTKTSETDIFDGNSDSDRTPLSNNNTKEKLSVGMLKINQKKDTDLGTVDLDDNVYDKNKLDVNIKHQPDVNMPSSILDRPLIDMQENTSEKKRETTERLEDDLLRWCQSILVYYDLNVQEMESSWRDGMAFCALIHYFRPDLLDFYNLSRDQPTANWRKAFEAMRKLKVSHIINIDTTFDQSRAPNEACIITYLHQLREHFTGKNNQSDSNKQLIRTGSVIFSDSFDDFIHVEVDEILNSQLNHEFTNSSLNIAGPINELMNSSTDDSYSKKCGGIDIDEVSNSCERPMDILLKLNISSSRSKLKHDDFNTLLNLISPLSTSDVSTSCCSKSRLSSDMTSFGDGPDKTLPAFSKSLSTTRPQTKKRTLMQQQEYREKTQRLTQLSRRRSFRADGLMNQLAEEVSRRTALREKARHLIASAAPSTSVTCPDLPAMANATIADASTGDLENAILKVPDPVMYDSQGIERRSDTGRPEIEGTVCNEVLEPSDYNVAYQKDSRILPSLLGPIKFNRMARIGSNFSDTLTYVQKEKLALEKEMNLVEVEAKFYEKHVRTIMDVQKNDQADTSHEERLMRKFLRLINKKNMLLRRQAELNIMERDQQLCRYLQSLRDDLSILTSIPELEKTSDQVEEENELLKQLQDVLSERDKLLHEKDFYKEHVIQEADALTAAIKGPLIDREGKKCSIS